MDMAVIELSRLQFALTAMYHFLFVPLTLGLSFMLTNDLKNAEATLRRAAASPRADSRIRQNLALALGLEGKFPEAEQVARSELSPDQAEANVAYLKGMLSQQNTWRQIKQQSDMPPKP